MKNRSLDIPYIGQRIVKTGIAVFLCLVVYYQLGYRGQSVPAEAVLLKQLLEDDPAMKAFHVYSENGYHTEHDALRVLSRIERKNEPFSLSSGRKQEKQ